MFITKDKNRPIEEADKAEPVKSSCEVHGGNLFVQLHFKAVKDIPDKKIELINTVVTSNDESSAKFSGCGKHLVAVHAAGDDDDDAVLTRDDAVKYIRAYLGTMFGQDVGKSLKDEDIHTIDEKGQEMNAADLKKWEEQRKENEKKNEKKNEKEGEKKNAGNVNESIPSFGRFMLSEEDAGAGSADPPDEDIPDDLPDEKSETEPPAEKSEAEPPEEESEAEDADEEVPPPATYFACYMITAEGQPEKDHTDSKTIESLSKKGKLVLPGSRFNIGIEFKSGGATVSTLDLGKLGREIRGKVDADQLSEMVSNIFRKNFPKITVIENGIRDARTLSDEIRKMKFQEDDEEIRKALGKIGKTRYSFYMQLKDNPAKPYVNKSDIIKIVNASLKQMGGRWLKFMSGVGKDDVIELHSTTQLGADTKAERESLYRAIPPDPEQIQNIIDGPGQVYKNNPSGLDSPKIWSKLVDVFKKLGDKNQKFDDHFVKRITDVWADFHKDHKDKLKTITYKDFDKFYKDYKKVYNDLSIKDRLNESFLSERALMRDLFSDLYEDDAPDEEFDSDVESGAGEGRSAGEGKNAQDDDVKFQAKIFILPMKHLDKMLSRGDY